MSETRMTRADFLRTIAAAAALPFAGGMMRLSAQMRSQATSGPVDPDKTGGGRGSITFNVVVSLAGKGVAGAKVSVTTLDKQPVANASGATNDKGLFTLALKPGKYIIWASVDGKSAQVTATITAATKHVILKLPS